MPIFDDVIPSDHLWPIDARWPRRRVLALIERFQVRFPSLHYDMYWETGLMNALAFLGREGRSVRLYGGLGRHRQVGIEGLAFALAHETGHHLGGPPHHPFYSSLSSEERANEWAMKVGLLAVFGAEIGNRYAYRGPLQLEALSTRYSINSVIW